MIQRSGRPIARAALDIVLGLHRQHLAAGQADEDRRGRKADGDHRVGQARAEEGGERDRQDQERASPASPRWRARSRRRSSRRNSRPAGRTARRPPPRSRPRRRPPSARRGRRRSGARRRRGRARRCRANARPTAPGGSPGSWSANGSCGCDQRRRGRRARRRARTTAPPATALRLRRNRPSERLRRGSARPCPATRAASVIDAFLSRGLIRT